MTKILSNKSSVNLDYPICRPSLDLDFTQEVLDNRITFTRGSIGTRVNRNRLIETVSANQPRFDYDPVTGECKGLLIEESRQNLLQYSQQFDNAYWSKPQSSISPNVTATTAPDGTNTAGKLVEDTTKNQHIVTRNLGAVTIGTIYTFSCWIKAAERTQVTLTSFNEGYSVYNLSTGTIIQSGGNTVSIISYPNGWYRCVATITKTNTTGAFYIITWNSSSGNNIYQGDGTSGIYVWGAQLEQGAFPTSYIPTTASTVTRSADNASITGTNFSSWYNQSEGTVYTKANSNNLASGGVIFIASNASYTERFAQLSLTGNIGYGYGVSWITNSSVIGGGAFTLVGDTYANGAYKKIALSGIAGNFNGVSGNQVLSTKKTNLYPTGITQARIGSYNNNVSYLNGTISRLTYYPRALKPNQLQMLTS